MKRPPEGKRRILLNGTGKTMENEEIKERLLRLADTSLDFTVVQTGKESVRVNGLYDTETHEILLHNKNFTGDDQLIYTAVHEFTHHLETERFMAENGGRLPMKGTRVHSKAFWSKFHELIAKAEEIGIYRIAVEESPELAELTKRIKSEFIEANGRLMVEFGKLLAKAHELCKQANIRYEDYLDRVLCLPRSTAKEIQRVSASGVNPAIGFDNMKQVAAIKDDGEKAAAAEKILGGTPPDTIEELRKKKKADDTPREKLEKEKARIEKTIESLKQRLQYVEETLETL